MPTEHYVHFELRASFSSGFNQLTTEPALVLESLRSMLNISENGTAISIYGRVEVKVTNLTMHVLITGECEELLAFIGPQVWTVAEYLTNSQPHQGRFSFFNSKVISCGFRYIDPSQGGEGSSPTATPTSSPTPTPTPAECCSGVQLQRSILFGLRAMITTSCDDTC